MTSAVGALGEARVVSIARSVCLRVFAALSSDANAAADHCLRPLAPVKWPSGASISTSGVASLTSASTAAAVWRGGEGKGGGARGTEEKEKKNRGERGKGGRVE